MRTRHPHKKIRECLILILLGMVFLSILCVIKRTPMKTTLVFKESIILEYGQELSGEQNTKRSVLSKIDISDIIEVQQSQYEAISFFDKTNSSDLDTMTLGIKTGSLYTREGENWESFSFQYEVRDTNKPIIKQIQKAEIIEGMSFDINDYFEAEDIIDGKLEVILNEDALPRDSGQHNLEVISYDKHGNQSTMAFALTIIAAPKEDQIFASFGEDDLNQSEIPDQRENDETTSAPPQSEQQNVCEMIPGTNIGNAGIIFETKDEAEKHGWEMLGLWSEQYTQWSNNLSNQWHDSLGNRLDGFETVAETGINAHGNHWYKFKPDKDYQLEWDYYGFWFGTISDSCGDWLGWYLDFYGD